MPVWGIRRSEDTHVMKLLGTLLVLGALTALSGCSTDDGSTGAVIVKKPAPTSSPASGSTGTGITGGIQ